MANTMPPLFLNLLIFRFC